MLLFLGIFLELPSKISADINKIETSVYKTYHDMKKSNYRFNSISIKILGCYFMNINKLTPKFIWTGTRHRIANIILKNKMLGD